MTVLTVVTSRHLSQLSILILAALLWLSAMSLSQANAAEPERVKVNYPETEIFLIDIDLSKSSNVLSNAKNVTQRKGYDNQPYFTKNGDSFLYSRGDDYQTDVYEYFLSTDKSVQVTDSDATEFSPTPFDGDSSISFVSDRNASIWFAKREQINTPQWAQQANDNREPIGYYAWNHQTGDILFWSQYGFSLTLVHESSQQYHFVTGHAVPSTPHIIPGTNKFSFVHRQTNGQVWIKEFDPKDKSMRPLVPLVGANANYGWASDGSILMIENDQLYRWHADSKQTWQVIDDLSKHGISNANRLALSPDNTKIAIVGLDK